MIGGLGRGLGSLIPNKLNDGSVAPLSVVNDVVQETGERVKQVEVDRIKVNPWQPREHFDHGEMEDLVESIKQYGILQPLIVSQVENQMYQLIAGERRLRAAQILELKTVPCLVRDTKDLERFEIALIENVQRSNLNPLEEAKAYLRLMSEFSLTQEEVAKKVGKKRTTVANILRLLDLPEQIQKAIAENKISLGHAKVILSATSEPERLKVFKKILDLNLTVRQTEGEVKKVSVKAHQRVIVRDVELEEKEDALRKALGTKVKIKKEGDSGTVTIDFYSNEELDQVVKKITANS